MVDTKIPRRISMVAIVAGTQQNLMYFNNAGIFKAFASCAVGLIRGESFAAMGGELELDKTGMIEFLSFVD